ncbi:hypothetical protein LTR53_004493 [Teratosphaeriaceae sp. CCFEE 6253]|nr:hypothetical protein LTR53_004493 [Teratosphaeriaceae sp. CCFEE 6253]
MPTAIIERKTVLITGCSAGSIGHALAKCFHAQDYHVFATVRSANRASDLASIPDVEILELDVTVPESVTRCKDIVSNSTGGKLDILINMAGIETQSPLLDVDLTEAKDLFDVNVWGPIRMVQAFSPLLIEAKGIVVNQSSIDAALSMVWAGVFSSSKAALARLSETLRIELDPLGVRVVTIICGSVNTPMFTKPGSRLELPKSSYYLGVEDAAYKERMEHRKQASQVDRLAEGLVHDILGGARSPVWRGALAPTVRFMTWALPAWVLDNHINGQRGIKLVKRP